MSDTLHSAKICVAVVSLMVPTVIGGSLFLILNRKNPAVASRELPLMLMSFILGMGNVLVAASALIASNYGVNISCHLVLWPSTLIFPLFFLVRISPSCVTPPPLKPSPSPLLPPPLPCDPAASPPYPCPCLFLTKLLSFVITLLCNLGFFLS